MKNISATIIGLITGILMILISVAIYAAKGSFENALQYITYAMYVGGIIWAMQSYQRSAVNGHRFKSYFAEGFKCLIVVTLLMVIFTIVFLKMHPELKDQMAAQQRTALAESGNYTAQEIDERISQAKNYFSVVLTSFAIFGYLGIGALVSAISAYYFSQQNKSRQG